MNPDELTSMASDTSPRADAAPLPFAEDPDRNNIPGVQSWAFVVLVLGLVALAVATVLTLLLTGTVTWAEIKDFVLMLGSLATGAGVTHGAHKAGGH